jgi:small subunit ribosomal protein S17
MADTEIKRGRRKERTGVVLSAAMNKTIVVQVERKTRHPLYGKEMRQIEKFYAHDEDNKAKAGDKVLITETRPLSKLKRWRLVKVLEAETAPVAG